MTAPFYADEWVSLYHGDCLEVLATLPDASVDSVVTDPPYGLEFMGREWDSFAPQNTTAQRSNAGGFGSDDGKPWNKARTGTKGVRSTFRCRACQGWSGTFSEARAKRQKACECDAPDYDYAGAPSQTVAFGKWCELWTAECLRVLKPGGHMLAFGGTRTWHRLACAVEDAGFEIRDSIAWLYGSGFPKSLDVSKAIDKAAGAERGRYERAAFGATFSDDEGTTYGTALDSTPLTPDAERWQGWGTALKPSFEPIVVARKPLIGTVAANVLQHGTGALNIAACRVGNQERTTRGMSSLGVMHDDDWQPREVESTVAGRWPANVLLDGSQAAELDRQSGESRSNERRATGNPIFKTSQSFRGGGEQVDRGDRGHADVGGASRFFPTFRYEAKAPTSERPRVDGIAHPTVKPLDLMRWLVRLVTPPDGTVLEPFAGSGTTAEACVLEGFQCIAIEREADYLPLIVSRLSKPMQLGLDFGDVS